MAVRIFAVRTTSLGLKAIPARISTFPYQVTQFYSTNRDSISPVNPIISDHALQLRKRASFVSILSRYGFPPTQLHDILIRSRQLLFKSNLQDIEKSLCILLSFKIPQDYLVSMVCDCPAVLELEFLKKWETGFSELGLLSCSPLMIQSVLKHSRQFQLEPDEFHWTVKVLKDIGFSERVVIRVLEDYPLVVMMNKGEIFHRIEFLIGIGIPRDNIDWIFYSFPRVLGLRVNDKLMTLISEFKELGFRQNVIGKEIVREPRILGMELGELSRCMQFLSSLKCREPIKKQIFSEGEFRAGLEVKQRVSCLCFYGLIRREAFKVLWKEPRLITYKIEDIEKKIEFLMHKMKFRVDCLVEVPEYLGMNFEKQIVPRYNVINYLGAQGGLGCQVGLRDIFKPSRLGFYNRFVKPYPECEKMFGRFSGDIEAKSRHPAGLWKLFKPERFPESIEAMKNMKSFMESMV